MRPTTEESAEVEYELLTSKSGRALIAEVGQISKPSPADLTRWRKSYSMSSVSAALRIAETRRKGASKFAKADRMWFEPTALEQSTSEVVARHKARRFEGRDVLDLCCGIGGDAISFAQVANRVVAVDRDLGMLKRLNFNATVYDCRERLLTVKAMAETVSIPSRGLVHIDPDRRAAGVKRAKNLQGYSPDLGVLRSLLKDYSGGAIKLGPASDFTEHFGGEGQEIEVVSLHGECKEATIWFGSLATTQRRATTLPSGASWIDRATSILRVPLAPLGEYLYEPDLSLIRSGLVDSFARANGLSRYLEGIDFLTSDSHVDSPFLTAFSVVEELPADRRMVARHVHALNRDVKEVKTRGFGGKVAEEMLHALQGGSGDFATVFLLKGFDRSRAVIATRL